MYAKIQLDTFVLGTSDKRAATGARVTLPISIGCGGSRHNAILRNLSTEGALIDTSAVVHVREQIEFQCGPIAVRATIIWKSATGIGIDFHRPLTVQQMNVQLARSAAVLRWREGHKRARMFEANIAQARNGQREILAAG